MNHFMARLIFCFFAENTDIFNGTGLFTDTIGQMSARDSSDTHEVIAELFRAMNTKIDDRTSARIPRWADTFPYVNGGLFSGSMDVPRFSRIARSYLLHIGSLDWTKINPDIFGSMIQAVAEDEERGALGMHYTSVPNILKVLNPLFLDDLRARLEEAGDKALIDSVTVDAEIFANAILGNVFQRLRDQLLATDFFEVLVFIGAVRVLAHRQARVWWTCQIITRALFRGCREQTKGNCGLSTA